MKRKSSETDYYYALLCENQMDAMFLPAGAVAWLWSHQRPQTQIDAAIVAAATATRCGNPVSDAALLRADRNILVLHLQSGESINVYPDGGYGSRGEPIAGMELEAFVMGTSMDVDVAVEPEPVVELPPIEI